MKHTRICCGRFDVTWNRTGGAICERSPRLSNGFVKISIKKTIGRLIGGIDEADPFQRTTLKETLAAFGEISFKQVLELLDDSTRLLR